jgi:hypothetical protein
MPNRSEVYAAIDSERDYQDRRWSAEKVHTPSEWLLYMQDYLSEAIHIASRQPTPQADPAVLEIIRKIAGMGVACMEQNGAPKRGTWIPA